MKQYQHMATAWFRYYSQLDDMACELRESENGYGYFSDGTA
ncbi:hypothetical protein [Anaerotruncus colihominis]|nr:hypothetical protein [Anaerotruncus colihominis]